MSSCTYYSLYRALTIPLKIRVQKEKSFARTYAQIQAIMTNTAELATFPVLIVKTVLMGSVFLPHARRKTVQGAVTVIPAKQETVAALVVATE